MAGWAARGLHAAAPKNATNYYIFCPMCAVFKNWCSFDWAAYLHPLREILHAARMSGNTRSMWCNRNLCFIEGGAVRKTACRKGCNIVRFRIFSYFPCRGKMKTQVLQRIHSFARGYVSELGHKRQSFSVSWLHYQCHAGTGFLRHFTALGSVTIGVTYL